MRMDTDIECNIGTKEAVDSHGLMTAASMEVPTIASSTDTEQELDVSQRLGHTLPTWYPKFRGKPVLYGYPEALGWLLSNSGHSVYLIGGGAFIVPAILRLATEEAGCETEPLEGEVKVPDCHNKVYGMKPSSLVTTVASVIALVVAVMIPLIGAVIDYTEHRRLIGKVLSLLYCLAILPQIFVSEDTWFPVLIVLLILGFIMWNQTLVLHAYLPELTEKEEELNQLTKAFSVFPFASIIAFIFLILGIATALGARDDEVITARMAAIASFALLSVLYGITWGYPLMGKRPASHQLQDGQSLWTAGFQKIYHTSCKIYKNYTALLWFYVATAFGDVKPITAIAITFFTDQLQFTPTENGTAAIIMLIFSVPGALFSSWFTRKFNPIWGSIVSMGIMIIFSSLAALILTGPDCKIQTYIIVAGWGIGGGFKHTATRMLASAISPKSSEAEMMGYYLFADQSLSWLPPLVFTAMNEFGLGQRIGILSLNIYFLIALVAYYKMGDYREAVRIAGRLNVGIDATQKLEGNHEGLDDSAHIKIAPDEGAQQACILDGLEFNSETACKLPGAADKSQQHGQAL
jgi:UMF1 family MFS transporter